MKADVVVVGGGVTGASAAYHLAAAGAEVVARRAARPQHAGLGAQRRRPARPDPARAVPRARRGVGARVRARPSALMQAAIRYWRELEHELDVDLEVNVSGGLIVAADDAQLRDLERKAAIERSFGVETELLDRDGLRRIAPYVSDRMAGGLFCPLEGRANPLLAAPALARAALPRAAPRCSPRTDGARARADARRRVPALDRRRPDRVRPRRRLRGRRGGGRRGARGRCLSRFERWPLMVSATEPAPPLVDHLVYFAGGRLTLKQARRGTILIGGGWAGDGSTTATGRLATDFPGWPRTCASRSRSFRRSRQLAAPHVARRVPRAPRRTARDRRAAPGLRRRPLPVPRLHLRPVRSGGSPHGSPSARSPRSTSARSRLRASSEVERRDRLDGSRDRDRLERRRGSEPVLLGERHPRPPRPRDPPAPGRSSGPGSGPCRRASRA